MAWSAHEISTFPEEGSSGEERRAQHASSCTRGGVGVRVTKYEERGGDEARVVRAAHQEVLGPWSGKPNGPCLRPELLH